MEDLMEQLADAEHASWGRWMLYLFETCQQNPDGSVTIPPALVKRWDRQANTPYRDLTEREKASDRDEVRRILPLIDGYTARLREALAHYSEGYAGGIGDTAREALAHER